MQKSIHETLDEASVNGTCCLVCKDNDELDFCTIVSADAETATEEVSCNRCGSSWITIWNPVGLTGLELNIEVRDNDGRSIDRYTIIYPDGSYIAANADPASPNAGFWQHGEGLKIGGNNDHLGRKIHWRDLPLICQQLVIKELQSDFQTER